ncbi:hypothetical protein OESDEN_03453, partial [Oesophagostomum dentatum]
DIVVPERAPHTTAEVSQTVTDEGFVRHVDQDFPPTQIVTTQRTETGDVFLEEGGKAERDTTTITTETLEQEAAEQRRRLEQLEKMEREVEERLQQIPEVKKQVTQTTSSEGWVQHVEDTVPRPKIVQTTTRTEKKETIQGGILQVSLFYECRVAYRFGSF